MFPAPPSPQPPTSAPLVMMTHEFPPHRGGIALYAAEMASAAVRLGHRVEVWASTPLSETTEPDWPFVLERLPHQGTHGLRCQWESVRFLVARRHRLHDAVLYVPEPGPMLALMLLQYLRILRPARLLLTVHGTEILRFGARLTLRRPTARLFAKADRIGAVSRFTRNLLLDRFPNVADKVVLTPGALREDFVAHTAPPFPAPADAPGRRLVILTVARLHPRKGQLHLLETLRSLPADLRSRLEYRIVGAHSKENYEQRLRKAANSADFPVRFLGDVPDERLGEVYRGADIFAMTGMPHKNSVEGFGIVYLEAGAHGLPVLAHDIGGVSDAVTHDSTGLLVAPDDRAALASALSRLLTEPELRHRLGENGRIHAHRHSWNDSAAALFGHASPAASSA